MNIEFAKNKKIALVLSGGVVKAAAWHMGVALALEELGFTFKNNLNSEDDTNFKVSTYVGSSAGALMSIYLASGLSPHDLIHAYLGYGDSSIKPVTYRDLLYFKKSKNFTRANSTYNPFERFPLLVRNVLRPILNMSGIFSTEGLKNYLLKNVLISNDFKEYASDLFIVATQLDSSKKVVFSKYNYPSPYHDSTSFYYTGIPIADAAAASMAIPGFFSPFPIKNPQNSQTEYYIDGEIRETLSTHVAFDNKCDFIISSWVHSPYHYTEEIGSLANYGIPAICLQAILLLIQKKIIASRDARHTALDIIDTINEYMVSNKFSAKDKKYIIDILERKLNIKRDVTLVDIYPDNKDYQLFFANSFSLSPEKTSMVLRLGYKKTFEVFKAAKWEK